ncbi:beta-galactosidase [Marisediminicola sp. LYQ134]|uniref:beta-galactosidase n=1 Tax=unclassified Marisediminicola TaxID=2618316 RepID=UPI00398317E0
MSESTLNRRWVRPTTDAAPRIEYGADYNPDQWPREVWDDDIRLMREAGVTIVSVAIFSWARIQPAADVWDFEWLDDVMDLLHANGISVDLATATASPPPWLTTAHPEILPVTRTGEIVYPGARQHWRPTSAIFREHAVRLVEAIATRYAEHPALAAWHISNELGCHNIWDYSDDAAREFRLWLERRYGTIDALNAAWGTAFWSQRYGTWNEILPPRLTASHPNPTQQIDFKRFSSDALQDYLRVERDILRRITPEVPITTNFMVMNETKGMDYAAWADEIDFVSNDHYVMPGSQNLDELSFSASLTGYLGGGRPWFLMEHSTSAVNWQPINVAKKPGSMARDSLTHVAHGADAVCFFQWRQSAAGAEKFHSGMVPHAGEHSALFRDVVGLGDILKTLAPVAGSHSVAARAAILFDWDSWWAVEQDSHPTELLNYKSEALDWYSAFLDLGVRADVVPTGTPLDGYDVVVAPVLYVMPQSTIDELTAYTEQGGHLVTTYSSGIVDENDHVWLGGYPGALRDVLGIRIEEFGPLLAGETVSLDSGAVGSIWTDRIDVTSEAIEVLARYDTGDQAGRPAVTRNPVGSGTATYVSTRLGQVGIATVLRPVLERAGVESELPEGVRGLVELAVRGDGDEQFWFLINRTDAPVPLDGVEGEVLVNVSADDPVAGELGTRGVAVVRRQASDAHPKTES